jgi:F-type H+-transporting ATPase subunit b
MAQAQTPQSTAPTTTAPVPGAVPGGTPGATTELVQIPEGHGGAFPPFRSDTFVAQIIWLALAFGLLYYLMSKIALPRIGAILHERSARLGADLAEAQRMKTEAEAAGAAYETSLAEARDRSKAIAGAARDAAAAEADTKRKALEADLAARLAASESTIRERTATAMGNVREIAGETASAIVERLTGQAPDRAQLDAALGRTLAH